MAYLREELLSWEDLKKRVFDVLNREMPQTPQKLYDLCWPYYWSLKQTRQEAILEEWIKEWQSTAFTQATS